RRGGDPPGGRLRPRRGGRGRRLQPAALRRQRQGDLERPGGGPPGVGAAGSLPPPPDGPLGALPPPTRGPPRPPPPPPARRPRRAPWGRTPSPSRGGG